MNVLILGANSDMAGAVANKMAQTERADVCLASRDMALLEKKAMDIKIKFGVKASTMYFNALDYASHGDFYTSLAPKPDGVVLAFGYFGEQTKAQHDFGETRKIIETNFLGAVSILEIIAVDFEKRGHGFIIGISSVAGERGRQSNYIYGSAKGAMTVYLSGLRNRLCRRGVKVITVLPGFVWTKMTVNMALPEKLTGDTDEVAEDIYRALKKNQAIVYTRWYWRWIMFIIRTIPEKLFVRMNL